MYMDSTVNFRNYGHYSSDNYGAHTLVFTDSNGDDFYFSYQTVVAFRHNGILHVCENVWGTTTGKHLNWIDGGSKKAKAKREDRERFLINLKNINNL